MLIHSIPWKTSMIGRTNEYSNCLLQLSWLHISKASCLFRIKHLWIRFIAIQASSSYTWWSLSKINTIRLANQTSPCSHNPITEINLYVPSFLFPSSNGSVSCNSFELNSCCSSLVFCIALLYKMVFSQKSVHPIKEHNSSNKQLD